MDPWELKILKKTLGSTQVRPRRAKVSQLGPKRGTKEPKMVPREAHEYLRMDQRGPKGSPKGAQEAKKLPM